MVPCDPCAKDTNNKHIVLADIFVHVTHPSALSTETTPTKQSQERSHCHLHHLAMTHYGECRRRVPVRSGYKAHMEANSINHVFRELPPPGKQPGKVVEVTWTKKNRSYTEGNTMNCLLAQWERALQGHHNNNKGKFVWIVPECSISLVCINKHF